MGGSTTISTCRVSAFAKSLTSRRNRFEPTNTSRIFQVTARYDERTDSVLAIAALDNLAKGASGGAVQAVNVALGLDETAGLASIGLAP